LRSACGTIARGDDFRSSWLPTEAKRRRRGHGNAKAIPANLTPRRKTNFFAVRLLRLRKNHPPAPPHRRIMQQFYSTRRNARWHKRDNDVRIAAMTPSLSRKPRRRDKRDREPIIRFSYHHCLVRSLLRLKGKKQRQEVRRRRKRNIPVKVYSPLRGARWRGCATGVQRGKGGGGRSAPSVCPLASSNAAS